MKIKMAATMLLCSFVMMCSEVNAAGLVGQLLQDDCGCQAAAPVVVESCGCEAATDEGCGCRQPVRGLLSRLGGGCGCGAAAPAADCGCEPVAPVVEEPCGCQSAGLNGGGGFRGLLQRMAGQVPGDCGCGPSCEEPAVVEPVVVEADCGCEAAPAAAPSCGCQRGGLIGRMRARNCGCGGAAPAAAPVADCGCAPESTPAPVADCGCAPEPAAVADCGCEADAAPAPEADSGAPVGLLGKLRARDRGCGAAASAPAVVGCGDAVASDCGCDAAPEVSSCGDCGSASCGGGCQLGQRLQVGQRLQGGQRLQQVGQRLQPSCNRCGSSSCNGGCRNRGSNGLTLLDRLRGDRIVRDTSNCGRCMPVCPNMGHGGCNTGCDSGCSSCGDAVTNYEYAPASMEAVPVAQPTTPVTAPPVTPAATTEGTIVPEAGGSTTRSAAPKPVVDSAAFVPRKQR